MADNLTINNNNNNNVTTRRNDHYYWLDSLFTRFLYWFQPSRFYARFVRRKHGHSFFSCFYYYDGFFKVFFSQKAFFKRWYDIDRRTCVSIARLGLQFNFCRYIFTINTTNMVFELPLKAVPMKRIAWGRIKRNIFLRVVFSFVSHKYFGRNGL